jgi:hypothetical protein
MFYAFKILIKYLPVISWFYVEYWRKFHEKFILLGIQRAFILEKSNKILQCDWLKCIYEIQSGIS